MDCHLVMKTYCNASQYSHCLYSSLRFTCYFHLNTNIGYNKIIMRVCLSQMWMLWMLLHNRPIQNWKVSLADLIKSWMPETSYYVFQLHNETITYPSVRIFTTSGNSMNDSLLMSLPICLLTCIGNKAICWMRSFPNHPFELPKA